MLLVKNVSFIGLLLVVTNLASALQIIRGPYLQISSPTSVTIRWRTDSLCTSVVRYGFSDTNLNNSYLNISQKTDHRVTLQNLAVNTIYYYSVGGNTITLSTGNSNYFRTPPIPSVNYNQPIRFWAVGDMSKQTPQQHQVRDAFMNYTQGNYVDGWIMLGDNAYEGGFDNEYQLGFFNYYQSTILPHLPLFPVIGNHDYNNDSALRKSHVVAYYSIFDPPTNAQLGGVASNNPMYYSFDYGNVHFVNLDSYGLELVGTNYLSLADTNSPQVNWLKQDLTMNTLPWVVVSFHHPPYGLGTHHSDLELDLVAIRTNLLPILERYNVDLVLNGHDHSYQRSNFIKNHFGLEASFDSTIHLRQSSTGRYDGSANSCAYIKHPGCPFSSDSGTVYVVAGSGSAAPYPPMAGWPHNAMSYSNYLNNGSLLLTVEGNQLLGEWISNDTNQIVKDRFVILKNAGGNITYISSPGASVSLQSSWSGGSYLWSTGDTTKQISFIVTGDTTLTVSDLYGCVQDTFTILISTGNSFTTKTQTKLYPNPICKQFMVQAPYETPMDVALFNLQGQLVFKQQSALFSTQHSFDISDHFSSGNYILEVKTTQGIERKKISLMCN